ncbi:M48 family metalloprotease [Aquimarina macrocephali]|uniref:M48 family metalloprotease n=1 Tax=Aquimarina macrocephali TaxID=666563 RepID=UPI003F6746C2
MKLSARKKIELIQIDSYIKSGIDYRTIKLDSLTKIPVNLSEKLKKNITLRNKAIINRKELTDFQDLNEISVILECWDLLISSNSKDVDSRIDNLTIACAPTGNMNAMAITGINQSIGILFENHLPIWAIILSNIITELITTETKEELIIHHPKDLKTYTTKEDSMERFVQFYLDTIQYGKPPALIDSIVKTPTRSHLQNLIKKGFISFIVGHEYAHITKNHHEKRASRRGPFMVPKNTKEIWELYSDKYKSQYPGISPEEFSNKIIDQYMEIEADWNGYSYVANTYNKYPEDFTGKVRSKNGSSKLNPKFKLMFVEIGIQLFLWSIEYLERLVRTMQRGNDGHKNDLFHTNIDVQNVILRSTHPCPLSRIKMLSQIGHLSEPASEWVEDLFKEFYKIAEPRAAEMHRNGIRPHPKWTASNTELHQFLFANK